MRKRQVYHLTALILILSTAFFLSACSKMDPVERTYYLNSISGNDSNDGLTPETAWQTLERASTEEYSAGEKLFLSTGCTFYGKLQLRVDGSKDRPVIVSSYGPDNGNASLPLIDAKGYIAAIQIENGRHVEISNLELIADAGTPVDTEASTSRYGVLVVADEPGQYPGIQLINLKIHHIFATENIDKDGMNPTSNMGMGIGIMMNNENAKISNVLIEGCSIAMTGHTGIRIFGYGDNEGSTYLDGVNIENNFLNHIGGPGMVPGRCENVVVRGNVVDHSGSSIDPRMHGRGSGIWPWTCNNVLIENNRFMHARGIADSCGAHIDFNSKNVVVQYNLSMDNAGGFVEILGNDHNCCYRYNISINDGFRIKGEDGAHQEGKVLWTSGYVGRAKKTGPFNSYIYNNTIYVNEDIRSCFSFAPTTDGILIANNIFYILGETVDVSGDQDTRVEDQSQAISNVVFTNNLYKSADILPASLNIEDSNPFVGDPGFQNTGGIEPGDYIPANISLIQNKGIKIQQIPGDSVGLVIGLEVKTDFFGNPIKDLPDMGAIEIQSK